MVASVRIFFAPEVLTGPGAVAGAIAFAGNVISAQAGISDAFVPADETAVTTVAREMAATTAPVSAGVLQAPYKSRLSLDELDQFKGVVNRGSFEETTAEIDRLVGTLDQADKPSGLFHIATAVAHRSVFKDRYEVFPLKALHYVARKAVELRDLTSFDPLKGPEYVNGYRTTLNWLYHFELHRARSGTEYTSEMQEMVVDIRFAAARTMALQSLIEKPDSIEYRGEFFSQILDAKLRYKKLGVFAKIREADEFIRVVEDRFSIRSEETIAGLIGFAEAQIDMFLKICPLVGTNGFLMVGLQILKESCGRYITVEILDRVSKIFEKYSVTEEAAELRNWIGELQDMDRDMGLILAAREAIAEAKVERIVEESGYGRDLTYDRVEKNIATVEKFRDYLVAVAGITQEAMTEFKHQELTQHANFFKFLEDIVHEVEALYAGTEDAKKIIALVSDIMHVKARYGQLYYAGSRDEWTEDQMRYEMPVVILELFEVIKRYRFVGEDDKAGDVEAFLERMKKRFDLPDGDLKEWALDQEKEYFEGSLRFLKDEEATGGYLKAMLSAFSASYTSAARSFGYEAEAEFLRWVAARLHELGHDEFVREKGFLDSAAKAEQIGKLLGL